MTFTLWKGIMKRLIPGQLEKYDIDEKIIKTLANLESRTILFSITQKAKNAESIAKDNKIPVSTVYRKLDELEGLTLVEIEKRDFSDHGHVIRYYRSRIHEAQISINKFKPQIILHKI